MAVPLIEWGFEEASGAVVNSGSGGSTYDYIPSGNVARTAAGGGDTMGGTVPNSKGLTVTGTDVVTGPFNVAMNSNARTMIVGIKSSSSDPAWTIEMRRGGTDNTGVFGLLMLSGTWRFRAKDSAGNAYERTLTADTVNYHYIAAVHDGVNTLKVYRDQSGGSATQVGADINMGGLIWAADDFRIFDGSQNAFIDNFRYFTSALTAAEIATWMNTPAPSSSTTNLTIQDASVASSSDSPVLTRIIDLAIQKMVSASQADPISLSQIHNIVINKAYVQSAADIVNFAGSSGGKVSVSDTQLQKLQVATGKTGTIADLEFAYYSGLSGLVPAATYSVTDHQRKYWETQTGKTGISMADLEKAFYDGLLIPSGSLADREYVYWTGL